MKPRLAAAAAAAAAVLLLAMPILWHLDPWRIASANVNLEQFACAELTAALVWAFASASRRTARLAPLVAAAAALFVGGALVAHHGAADAHFIFPTTRTISLSTALAALVLTACWLTSGRHFVLLILAFLALGYSAQYFGGALAAPRISPERYAIMFTYGGEGFLGRALLVISEIVAVFILFGVVIRLIGAHRAIETLALRATLRSRGAAIKVAVLASAVFGTISGSATSNVMTSGSFSITGMRKLGLSAERAGAVEAVASTLGQVIPPIMGAAAFLMADFTGLPYLAIVKAAIVPAVLSVSVLFFVADRWAAALPAAKKDETMQTAPGFAARDALYLVPVAGVIAMLMLRPDRVALAGIAGIALGFAAGALRNGWRATLRQIRDLPADASRPVAGLVIAGSALGCIVAVISITGFDVVLSIQIGEIGRDSMFLSLALCAVAAAIFGMGMATTGVYIVVAVMLAPGLVRLGLPALHAHFFVFYFSVISMITPPVGFATLAASGLSGAGFYQTGLAAVRFGWVLFLMPFLIVYFPGILLQGPLAESAKDIVAAVGVCIFCALAAHAPGLVRGRNR